MSESGFRGGAIFKRERKSEGPEAVREKVNVMFD
jgi:hypothetical protein